MGTVANIVQSVKLPDGNIKVLVEGLDRGRTIECRDDDGFFRIVAKTIPKMNEPSADHSKQMNKVISRDIDLS